jgi:hypothetical protein
MLFITLGDGPIDPSPRPPNQPIGPPHPHAIDSARVIDPTRPVLLTHARPVLTHVRTLLTHAPGPSHTPIELTRPRPN